MRPNRTTTVPEFGNDMRQRRAEASRAARRFREQQNAKKLGQYNKAFMEGTSPSFGDIIGKAPSKPAMEYTGVAPTQIGYSKGRKAQSVAEVVAAEAGGKTRAQRLSAMKDIYSAAYNRAQQTGETVESVIAGSNQFTAYNKAMPAGTRNLVDLAEQAISEVEQTGPTHKGTYYARSYATKNLPKGLKEIKKAVDDHVYYTDPKNRAIVTAAGPVRPQEAQVAQVPAGGLASFFSDPLGMRAQAAEAPQGLAAFASPTGYDPAQNPANARAEAMFAATPKGLGDTSFDARFSAQPSADRFASRPQVNVSGPVSPEHYTSVTGPRAAFDAAASGLGPDPGGLGALAGSMVGRPGMVTDDKGTYADTFGTKAFAETPKGFQETPGVATTNDLSNVAGAGTDLGSIDPSSVYGRPQQQPPGALAYDVAAAKPGLAAIEKAAPNKGLGSLLSPNMMAPGMQVSSALALSPENYNALQPPADPQVAEIAGNTIPDPTESYPDAPPEPTESLIGPNTKRALAGLVLGGPIGAALGYASGAIGKGLGGLGGPAGMASAGERYNAGSGINGINQGMYGPRGATGYSRSNPGAFSTSRGPNQGWDLTNQYGVRTTYGPSGDIRANADTNKAWGGLLGGLFGGKSKDKDKDKSGKGLGGTGYSGKGLY